MDATLRWWWGVVGVMVAFAAGGRGSSPAGGGEGGGGARETPPGTVFWMTMDTKPLAEGAEVPRQRAFVANVAAGLGVGELAQNDIVERVLEGLAAEAMAAGVRQTLCVMDLKEGEEGVVRGAAV